MYFKIPPIQWKERYSKTQDGVLTQKSWQTANTFIPYTAHFFSGIFTCYYGNGRSKEFSTLSELQFWVSQVHYPAQVSKYLEVVDG